MLTTEQIINKLGIQASAPEVQNRILQDLANSVATRILLRISEKLSDAQLDELSKLTDADDEAGVEAYISSKIPNFEDFKIQIEAELIDEIVTNREAVKTQISAMKSEII